MVRTNIEIGNEVVPEMVTYDGFYGWKRETNNLQHEYPVSEDKLSPQDYVDVPSDIKPRTMCPLSGETVPTLLMHIYISLALVARCH